MNEQLLQTLEKIRETLYILRHAQQGQLHVLTETNYQQISAQDRQLWQVAAVLPPLYPEWLGAPSFLATHHARFPYIVGEMANGIATAKMVVAAVKAGMVGFFGAAGLMPNVIEENLHYIKSELQTPNGWGSNLIHSPGEPQLEEAVVSLYLREGVERVSASAYMALSPHIVHYAVNGLRVDQHGQIVRRNHILAKLSRPEVAKPFMCSAPADMLEALVQAGKITRDEANLAAHIPVAEDITVEGDSGGHTDNRLLVSLFPTILSMAEQLNSHYRYVVPVRVGAAGGLGTPSGVAAAFAMGAAYVLTGSVNQSAVEAGLSEDGKKMLAQADIADVIMAPAADMFELGVKLQVLKRGSLFASRAAKLYEIYTRYNSLDEIPQAEKVKLEQQILGKTLAEVWSLTEQFFNQRDPHQIQQAMQNPKHKMALTFRWYLGLSSRWAIIGDNTHKLDYQIWCGPAMGAFNAWVAGTFLEDIAERTVAQIGLNLLEGAAVVQRAQQLRSHGLQMPQSAFDFRPRQLS